MGAAAACFLAVEGVKIVGIIDKEGGLIKWDTIQSAEKTEDGYLLHVSRGQFFYFPFNVFNSDHDKRLMVSILVRKSLL